MRVLTHFLVRDVSADRSDVLRRMGVAAGDRISRGVEMLIREATAQFERQARPVALWQDISADDFAQVYAGDDGNAPETPLETIFPNADALALFAATLGRSVDDTIRDLFDRGDAALGYAVDALAGCAAERLAQLIAERFAHDVSADRPRSRVTALAYSPGYCGWHVSGQRALFDHIRPLELGLALTASCLMDPVKSVSGVLVAGSPEIHKFRPTYPFCASCSTHTCRARIASVHRRTR